MARTSSRCWQDMAPRGPRRPVGGNGHDASTCPCDPGHLSGYCPTSGRARTPILQVSFYTTVIWVPHSPTCTRLTPSLPSSLYPAKASQAHLHPCPPTSLHSLKLLPLPEGSLPLPHPHIPSPPPRALHHVPKACGSKDPLSEASRTPMLLTHGAGHLVLEQPKPHAST